MCVVLFCLFWFGWFGFFFGEIGFQSQVTPVVDRPSLALVRQCRKKKKFWMEYDILVWDEADFMVVSMISVWL